MAGWTLDAESHSDVGLARTSLGRPRGVTLHERRDSPTVRLAERSNCTLIWAAASVVQLAM